MLKKFLLCFLIFFVSLAGRAQDFSNAVYWDGTGGPLNYQTGQLIILGDKKETPPEKFSPMQAVWNPEIPRISIKTPFQKEASVPYVLHIPYFFINIQLLTDRSAIVSEYVQIVVPPKTPVRPFYRSYLTKVKDALGREHTFNPTFLSFKQNGTSVPFSLVQSDEKIQIKFVADKTFHPSVYTYEVSYLLPDAVRKVNDGYGLFLSLLGNDIPYLTENLVVRLDFPKFTPILKADVTFGTENLKHPTAAYFVKEGDQALILKSRGVYPNGLDVRVNIEMGSGTFEEKTIGQILFDTLFKNMALGVTVLGMIFLVVYYILAAYLSWKEIKRPHFRKKIKFRPAVMRHLLLKKVDYKTLFGAFIDLIERKRILIEKKGKDYILTPQKGKLKQPCEERAILKHLLKRKTKLSEIRTKDILSFLQRIVRCVERRSLYRFYLWPFLTGIILIGVCEFILLSKVGASSKTALWSLMWLTVTFVLSWRYFKKHNAYPAYLRDAYEKEWAYLSDLPNKNGKNLAFYASMDVPLDDLALKSSVWAASKLSLDEFEKEFLNFFIFNGRKK